MKTLAAARVAALAFVLVVACGSEGRPEGGADASHEAATSGDARASDDAREPVPEALEPAPEALPEALQDIAPSDAAETTPEIDAGETYTVYTSNIYVTLLWQTPGDPDPTDGAGTDLDLHVTHERAERCDLDADGAPDPWFDPVWDVFSRNPAPDWGIPGYAGDDPRLTREDADGEGPENVAYPSPEYELAHEITYHVGVHYRDDHGFGPVFATLRVYAVQSLVFEVGDVELVPGDLWEVCEIRWPSTQTMLALNQVGNYKITPGYPSASPACP